MNIEKVYIVTSGEYSSYGIDAVFLDKEQAEMFCATHNSENFCGYMVEEYGIGKIYGELKYHKNIRVNFTPDGHIIHIVSFFSCKNIPTEYIKSLAYNNVHTLKFSVHKDATKEEIKKMAYDLRAKFLYESEVANGK